MRRNRFLRFVRKKVPLRKLEMERFRGAHRGQLWGLCARRRYPIKGVKQMKKILMSRVGESKSLERANWAGTLTVKGKGSWLRWSRHEGD